MREEVRRHDGASSDGCLAHIFRHAAKELFDEDVGELTYRALRCAGLGRPPPAWLCGPPWPLGIDTTPKPAAVLWVDFAPVGWKGLFGVTHRLFKFLLVSRLRSAVVLKAGVAVCSLAPAGTETFRR